jgi:hypothetical protein
VHCLPYIDGGRLGLACDITYTGRCSAERRVTTQIWPTSTIHTPNTQTSPITNLRPRHRLGSPDWNALPLALATGQGGQQFTVVSFHAPCCAPLLPLFVTHSNSPYNCSLLGLA